MTAQQLKSRIMSFTDDICFVYNNKDVCINPWNEEKFEVGFNNIGKDYTNIDDLMSDKFFDGKSLNEIAKEIDL